MHRCAAVLLFFPLSCFAGNGVYEINQLCVDSGCFSGDSPGWPVVLAQPGSYQLTSNLNVSAADAAINVTAIEITADGVSLDLNGFSIIGPKNFEGEGTGVGIYSFAYETSIANGQITGMGGRGIICGGSCRIDGVIATYNGSVGLQLSGPNLVTNSVVSANKAGGVVTNGVVQNCVISGNGGTGVFASSRSLIEGTQIAGNAGDGVECSGCSLRDNVISDNTAWGVEVSNNASFGGNQFNGNGSGSVNGVAVQTAPNNCDGSPC